MRAPSWEECRIGRRLVPFRHRARAASAPGWGSGGGRRSWHAFDCRGYRPAPPPLANATLERWRASYSRCHSPIARLGLSLTLSPLISPPVSLRSIFLQPRRGTRHRLARKRTRSWQTHRPPTSLDPLVRAARCAATVLLRARWGCSGVCAAARVAAAAAAAAVADAAAKLLPTTAAIAANACCEGARYVLLCCAPLLPFSPPPARALVTPLGTHTHSTPFLYRDRCWPAIDAEAQEAEGVQRWRHGRPDLLKSFNLSQHIFLEKHSIRTRVHMKRRTLSLPPLPLSACACMQAPVAKICAILRAISFFKRMKHFLENLETPTQAQTTSRHPLTATKDEKEYRTRSRDVTGGTRHDTQAKIKRLI